jgi:hypothetical protein
MVPIAPPVTSPNRPPNPTAGAKQAKKRKRDAAKDYRSKSMVKPGVSLSTAARLFIHLVKQHTVNIAPER